MGRYDERDPLLGSSAEQGHAGRPKGNFHSQSVLILIVAPFAMFMMALSLFTFLYHYSNAITLILIIFLLVCSLVIMQLKSKRFQESGGMSFYAQVGALCLVAVILGTLVGYWNFSRNFDIYWHYEGQRYYTNVLPTEPALGHLDAGKIDFSEDTAVAKNQSVGLKDGSTMYCVAPLQDVQAESHSQAEFFATGMDCCKSAGGFTCGDVDNPKAKSGLVVLKDNEDQIKMFRKAAQTAGQENGFSVSQDALFVQWTDDPTGIQEDYYDTGLGIFLGAMICYLVICALVGICVHVARRPTANKRVHNGGYKETGIYSDY